MSRIVLSPLWYGICYLLNHASSILNVCSDFFGKEVCCQLNLSGVIL